MMELLVMHMEIIKQNYKKKNENHIYIKWITNKNFYYLKN